MSSFRVHAWKKNPLNPVLPPGPNWFDVGCCMNPFVVQQGDEYFMFYAGGSADGHRRICLAIANKRNLTHWHRLGPVIDHGQPGSFDASWAVLPCVHRINGRWRLYYTGRSDLQGVGLQGFYGMGLATSDDLIHWTRHSDQPLIVGDDVGGNPGNRAIAGGGPIVEIPQPDGRTLYRMYYTSPTGTPSQNLLIDQAKHAAIMHSYDGYEWFDRRIILSPRLEADYENAAVIALNLWKTPSGYRAIYAGIGTRFGAYSICEAQSDDGLTWRRGLPNENLALPPSGHGWESQMTEYPHIVEEDDHLQLFYCGNGYGRTGIGAATAERL